MCMCIQVKRDNLMMRLNSSRLISFICQCNEIVLWYWGRDDLLVNKPSMCNIPGCITWILQDRAELCFSDPHQTDTRTHTMVLGYSSLFPVGGKSVSTRPGMYSFFLSFPCICVCATPENHRLLHLPQNLPFLFSLSHEHEYWSF